MAEAKPISIPSSPLSPTTPPATSTLLPATDTERILTTENSIIVLLDPNMNIMSDAYKNIVMIFQQHIHLIRPFIKVERCIEFITGVRQEKIFLVISSGFVQQLLSSIRYFRQIDSVYVQSTDIVADETWTKHEKKIRGAFPNMLAVYEALRRDVRQCEDDLLTFSVLSSAYNAQEPSTKFDQEFINNQLLKDALLCTEYPPNTLDNLVAFCIEKYRYNLRQMSAINDFAQNYRASSSIRWYAREWCISAMLNKAFRIRDDDTLLRMGFLIRDVHRGIKQFHSVKAKQDRLTVYRGQGISEMNFQKILDNLNGFLSFDNFLKATTDRESAKVYACAARDYHELVGVLFQMEVDPPLVSYTPLNGLSYDSDSEDEVLFSIDTIFRIHTVEQIENSLWRIELRVTTNDDESIKVLRQSISKDTQQHVDLLKHKL